MVCKIKVNFLKIILVQHDYKVYKIIYKLCIITPKGKIALDTLSETLPKFYSVIYCAA